MAAKNAETLRIMNQKVRDRELVKLYLCIACGHMEKREGHAHRISGKEREPEPRLHLAEALPRGNKHQDALPRAAGKEAVQPAAVELLTGRTHQIRAHLASIGHPLAGDGKYGSNALNRETGFRYQALCSYKLRFHFTPPAGILEPLNGQEFTAKDVWS